MIERRPHWDDALIEAVTALVSDLASRHEAGDLDYYRVQSDKRWWRRKWQAEWDGCRWAQRGYTRPWIRAMARVRRSHPAVDTLYIRCRIIIRASRKRQ